MSLQQLYDKRDDVCVVQEKFSFNKISDNKFKSNYPLEAYTEGLSTFGGEFVCIGAKVAMHTITDESFTLNSLHGYYLKAGNDESPVILEVEDNNVGKSFINKTVKIYQEATKNLVFIVMCSFTKDNYIKLRKLQYQNKENNRIPYEFQCKPNDFFYQYKDCIEDSMFHYVHTHDLITHAMPQEYVTGISDKQKALQIGDRRLGCFFKINDKCPDDITSLLQFLYISDSFYLGIICVALGMPVTPESPMFFRASLDHAVFIHDLEFKCSDWLFLDYTFKRMSNNRVLVTSSVFTLDERLVASISQEALLNFTQKMLEESVGGTYKL